MTGMAAQCLAGLLATAFATRLVAAADPDAASTACGLIEASMSSSVSNGTVLTNVVDLEFLDDIEHWFYVRSSQVPTCVVEVGSPEDVSMVMGHIADQRAPWAVKSGGHASNPGFSSTTGVHISLTRLDQTVLSSDKSTVEIGFGKTWSDVYDELQGSGVNVVGGRTVGPGVGGFTLGGGYSWKTNQFGLTCDTVKQYNLVLPNGTITKASSDTNPDIFWALKGGLNKFGIVTSAVFYTHPQPDEVYAGLRLYSSDALPALVSATNTFGETIDDPKAQVIATFNGVGLGLGTSALVLFFYDGADPGDAFAMFDDIDSTIDLVTTQTFANFVGTINSKIQTSPRGAFDVLPTTKLTPTFMNAVVKQAQALADVATVHGGILVSYDVEPFGDYGQHATDSAFPHSDSSLPLNFYYSWTSADDDEFWLSTLESNKEALKQVAIDEGIFNASFAIYPNYASPNATAEELYTAAGAARLRSIREAIDPTGIMDLTGGFTI